MSENITIPYVLQLKDGVNAIQLTNNIGVPFVEPTSFTFVPTYQPVVEQVCIQPATEVIQKVVATGMDVQPQNVNKQVNFVYEIVCPEQLNLKPIYNLKRGRPKKKKVEEPTLEPPKAVKLAPRTRSGRVVKFPKYIEKDFKKLETEDSSKEQEVKTSEFVRFEEDKPESIKNDVQLEFHQRRRKISAQYRCPKCNKAYLGKMKMMQHIRKYPDHGPVPHSDLNFDVWNYLVDITQKCPPAQRGIKFCEELTNLLHNVLLLTSALFKKAEMNKNHVDVDKVLGNAIGLPPGPYKFNENELYKDVTVLKLITNSDFFKPVENNQEGVTNGVSNGENRMHLLTSNSEKAMCGDSSAEKANIYFHSHENTFPVEKTQNESSPVLQTTRNSTIVASFEKNATETSPTSTFIKKNQPLDHRIPDHGDLLSDNSLLNLPNLRNSVDDLLSGVDSSTNLLDNSTSSDEVMNVDQFVNERFKKITEPEIEMNGAGLNLDLPSLDLFQFHTS